MQNGEAIDFVAAAESPTPVRGRPPRRSLFIDAFRKIAEFRHFLRCDFESERARVLIRERLE